MEIKIPGARGESGNPYLRTVIKNETDMERPEQVVVIEVARTDYSVTQVLDNRDTMNIKQLKEWLSRFDDDDETPVVLSHDNGYTYGPLSESCIDTREYDEEEGDYR